MKHFALLLLAISSVVATSVVDAAGGHGNRHDDGHRGGHYASHYGGHHRRHHGNHHRSHSSFILSYGGYYGDPYPYYPYSYPAQVIVQKPAEPVIYIEKSDEEGARYWYYCTEPKGYYPHVERCPVGWMKVVPNAPRP